MFPANNVHEEHRSKILVFLLTLSDMANPRFLADLVSDAKQVPSNLHNICNPYEKPSFAEIEILEGSIPLIDLTDLQGPCRSQTIQQIGQACQDYGFFMVKNHGIPETLTNSAVDTTKEFFELPPSERLKFSADGTCKPVFISTGLNAKTQQISYWKDALKLLRCYPLQDTLNEWPSNPPSFRKDIGEYCTSVRGLATTLMEAISESLGLESDYFVKKVGKYGQSLALNYYPPCPQPELVCGAPGHYDPSLISLLLQNEPGLQILNNSKWIAINPIPNTLVVNLGDMMQVLSNDRYKSVRHRVVVNSYHDRISVAAFLYPSADAVIGPSEELVDAAAHHHPAVYQHFTFSKFLATVAGESRLATKSPLDQFKSSSAAA